MENLALNLNTIYPATEGEGVRIGTFQVFVRFQGCAVGCITCDSKETWNFSKGNLWELESVLSEIKKHKTKAISITGGDPLHSNHRKALLALIEALKCEHYFINIEVTGLEFLKDVFSLVDFISMDLKTPSSLKVAALAPIIETIKNFSHKMQLKSVIETREDFEFVLHSYRELEKNLGPLNFPFVLTPCYKVEEEKPLERFEKVFSFNAQAGGIFRVILQQHKLVYGASRRDV